MYTQLSHPNVIRCVGVSPTPSHPLSLVLDAAGHLNLKEYLHRNPGVNRLELVRRSTLDCDLPDLHSRQRQVLGIARGLNHMHDRGIPHGHLTAVRSSLIPHFQYPRRLTTSQQNIFVDHDGTPRIAGFGSSFMLSCQDSWSESGAVGFHRGSAPELVRPRKPGKPANRITKASDMYAFGMLTWEVGIVLHRNLRSRSAHRNTCRISDLLGTGSVHWRSRCHSRSSGVEGRSTAPA